MQPMHLAATDLNLALVLHELLQTRSVSRAAKRLGLSQSATSHALARVRELLKDPILVRGAGGLVPTTRAEAMAGPVADALTALEAALFAVPVFTPATARATVRIGASDYAQYLVLPRLLADLGEIAPGIEVRVSEYAEDVTTVLGRNELDLVLAPFATSDRTQGLRSETLFDDRFVCLAREGHPLSRGKPSLERFLAARHVFITPRGRPGGVVDDALARLGRARTIALATPSFLIGPPVVADTNLVITLASRLATAFASTLPLALFESPLDLPGFRVAMFWHDRRHADPLHAFLRARVGAIAKKLPPLRDCPKKGEGARRASRSPGEGRAFASSCSIRCAASARPRSSAR